MTPLTRARLRRSWNAWLSYDLEQRGPWWLDALWTLLFCVAMAAFFTVFGIVVFERGERGLPGPGTWALWYGKNLIVSVTIGFTIHLLFEGALRLAKPRRIERWAPWQRTVFFTGVPLGGVLIGWPVGLTLAGVDWGRWLASVQGSNVILGSAALSVLIVLLLHQFFGAKTLQLQAEKRATEAQLRLLQAQMEPHFLFNTLANVQSLIDHEPAKARAMLESFTDYLRSTLAQLRTADATLDAELALAEAYLKLLATRMDERLRFSIDADPAARAVRMPPLLLQPLVENAIHHGLEPKVEGGSVAIRARVVQRALVVEVADDGRGLAAPPARRGAGVALHNLRERIAARYGDAARLELADAGPGTRATLTLPIEADRC